MPPYVLTLLHFNVQYCAGGLEGLSSDQSFDASDEALQDRIVEESFEPVLDVLDAHPSWTFTLEMQGLMVEIMADRHPEILEHLRTLALAGQVELVSLHWSDQLWVAYPAQDLEVSVELTRRAFEDAGLPLSEVVFSQEGQFSQGLLERMPDWGYRVAVLPPNLGSYLWGSVDEPLYRSGGTVVLPGTSVSGQVGWSFLNDGELWATNDRNCYLGRTFAYDPDATAEQVAELEALEAGGSKISGIAAYVEAVETGDEPELPAVLDGVWQPDDTQNLGLWMGGSGLWADTEQDNAVRTTSFIARQEVVAAQILENVGANVDSDALEQAWRELLLGEVSDASGWNPYETEVDYGIAHSEAARSAVQEAIAGACADLDADRIHVQYQGDQLSIFADEKPEDEVVSREDPPSERLPMISGRDATLSWTGSEHGWRLDVAFEEGEGDPAVSWSWDGLAYETVPALGDELVSVDASEIAADDIGLPLSWGIAGLGEGWYVAEHLDTVHLAALYSRADGTITFRDETAPSEAFTWSFELIGPETGDVEQFGWTHAVWPDVALSCPAAAASEETEDRGCGCATKTGGSPRGLLVPGLLLVALLRRRLAA